MTSNFSMISVRLCLVLFLITLGGTLYAQVSLYTAGEHVRTPAGSITYSVGQVMFLEASGSEGGSSSDNLTKPYEYYTTRIGRADRLVSPFRIYPNPAKDRISVESAGSHSEIQYSIADMSGRILVEGTVTGNEKTIHVGDLPPACYLLRLNRDEESTSFRLLKL